MQCMGDSVKLFFIGFQDMDQIFFFKDILSRNKVTSDKVSQTLRVSHWSAGLVRRLTVPHC